MYVFELVGTENHAAYQELAAENQSRQYSFLRSLVLTSLKLDHPMLSIEALKALNYHAIACLHVNSGEFRPWLVEVGDYKPPPHYQVAAKMQMFTNEVNRRWDSTDAVVLAAYVLWQLNHIHPFINGNGRTARAACHLILCLKSDGWLPGERIVPALLKENREEYVQALKTADASVVSGNLDLGPLHALLVRLIGEQLASQTAEPGG